MDRKRFGPRQAGLGLWLAGLCAACGAQAPADPLLDFRFFDVPTGRRIQHNPLEVRWLVRADAESHCQAIARKDGHVSRAGGCVYWVLAHGQCTVVTTAETTHSVLGHLYLHCLTGL